MDPLEVNESICRMCLEDNVVLHWDKEIIKNWDTSYKDCYYKYTQLEMPDVDPFGQMLCETCSMGLRNLHILIVKALESHAVLQQAYETQIKAADEYGEFQEIDEAVAEDNTKESDMFEPDNFDFVEFNQSTVEATTDEDKTDAEDNDQENDKDKTNENHNSTETQSVESAKNHQQLEKRVCKRSSWLDNGTFEDKTNDNHNSTEINSEPSAKNHQELEKRVRKRSSWLDNGTFEVNIPKSNRKMPTSSPKEETNEKRKTIKKQLTTNVDNPASNLKSKKNLKSKTEIVNNTETDESEIPVKKKRKPRALRTFMCSLCSKICKNAPELMAHEESHNGPQERSETCPKCGLKFWKKHVLTQHMKTHNMSRQKYQCEYCEKSYLNIAALNIHRRKHLGQMIPCPLCPKEFFRQVDLDRHNIAAHNAASLNRDLKKMPKYMVYCKECNKYLRTNSWRAHQANHLKEPLMKCSICDKEFFSRNTCTYHMDKIHSFKKREEYEPFIIYLKARLTHLMLEQQATLEVQTPDE